MHLQMKSGLKRAAWGILALVLAGHPVCGADSPTEPASSTPRDPGSLSFPALGSPAARKVRVEWNRFYDNEGLHAILAQLHEAFPELTQLYSIGKSFQNRDLWCLEVTAPQGGKASQKPGMYIDGNIHGNEVQGSEVVAYTAWYLCHQYGRLETVSDLLNHSVFYLVPTINPDGRDHWLHTANTASTSRSGVRPVDNDGDGLYDEDDYDDLDGDGVITQMRIKNPFGHWKPHPDYPDYLMVRVGPEERGEYELLGYEGIDNDNDGRINEDPVGGYDMNRNWAFDWQPNYIQPGALEYPFCLPETRAVAEFAIAHPNLAALQSYHNNGGMILRGPGREGGAFQAADDNVLRIIAQRGEKILPFYRSITIWKDLYTVWGGEIDWLYGARGILGFSNELWSNRNLDKSTGDGAPDQDAAFIKHVLLNEAVVKWKPYHHPTYGLIEIGGLKKEWGRTPVSFLLEEECHRNMAFTLYHAGQMPRLKFGEGQVEKLSGQLFRIRAVIENSRLMPTRSQQEVRNHISPPDVITLAGPEIKVLSSGRVVDRFFNQVEAVKRRPERLELETIDGMSQTWVQFIVSGRGNYQLKLQSAKGGILEASRHLPEN